MTTMARLEFGSLRQAWKGEASDFTPLLAEQLDALGSVIGVDLASIGEAEVPTAGGRRIDIVASDAEGSELVIENQYGSADHDHLTRGLGYAVARRARGLIVVAEDHRDEFRAVAQYLNELAELDTERGIAVWLVTAQAVRIDDSRWAPLFTPVVRPNSFTTRVEQTRQAAGPSSIEDVWSQYRDEGTLEAAKRLLTAWEAQGHHWRLGRARDHIVLTAEGPSVNGLRSVIAIYTDGGVLVPFASYGGSNSGIVIDALVTESFRSEADRLFGFGGGERMARTKGPWLTPERVDDLLGFCLQVAAAYRDASEQTQSTVAKEDGAAKAPVLVLPS